MMKEMLQSIINKTLIIQNKGLLFFIVDSEVPGDVLSVFVQPIISINIWVEHFGMAF